MTNLQRTQLQELNQQESTWERIRQARNSGSSFLGDFFIEGLFGRLNEEEAETLLNLFN